MAETTKGVRYNVDVSGEWKPVASLKDKAWIQSEAKAREMGEKIAKQMWYDERWRDENRVLSFQWTGMNDAQKVEAQAWFSTRYQRYLKEEENEEALPDISSHEFEVLQERDIKANKKKTRVECHTGCGVENAQFRCQKCKEVRECPFLRDSMVKPRS